jgi:biopolymer transport protein ExbD
MRRRRGHRSQDDVELNLAAMLDMAFQLLAFFIATFRPAPLEGQITLRLPPPEARTTQGTQPAGENVNSAEIPKGLKTLVINVFSDGSGEIKSLSFGDENATQVETLAALDLNLTKIFGDPTYPYEQVILQVSPSIRYERLMEVVDVLTRLKVARVDKETGRTVWSPLSKLSFVEAAGG